MILRMMVSPRGASSSSESSAIGKERSNGNCRRFMAVRQKSTKLPRAAHVAEEEQAERGGGSGAGQSGAEGGRCVPCETAG